MRDIQVFIIWSHARAHEKEIIALIKEKFVILKEYIVYWDNDKWGENLTAFYEEDMRYDYFNQHVRGTDEFLLIICEDEKPEYHQIQTPKGVDWVNIHSYDLKYYIRENITRNFNFHSSNNEKEARNNIIKILGISLDKWLQQENIDGMRAEIRHNCVGVDGWKSIESLFETLNECTQYVVLRGYENIPDNYSMEKDGDIDILVDDLPKFVNLLNPHYESENNLFSFFNYIQVGNEKVLLHAKYVGDYYYDSNWEKRILETRVFNGKIYIPSEEMLFWSLLYHGVYHKENYKKYEKILIKLAHQLNIDYESNICHLRLILQKWIKEQGYVCKLHLDGEAASLNVNCISDPKIIDNSYRFVCYKSYYKNVLISTTIIREDLLREKPELFSSLIRSKDRLLRISKNLINPNSPLYFELCKNSDKNEYVWRYAKRYDQISCMCVKKKNEKWFFHKTFCNKTKERQIREIEYFEEESEFIQGESLDFYLMRVFSTKSRDKFFDELISFFNEVFSKYGISDDYLDGVVWDLLSKNCIKNGDRYYFIDFEAKSIEPIKKDFYIAIEIEYICGKVYIDEPKEIYETVCKKMKLDFEDYRKYLNYHTKQVDDILCTIPNESMKFYRKYISEVDIVSEKTKEISSMDNRINAKPTYKERFFYNYVLGNYYLETIWNFLHKMKN